jgi:hypothetical protein
MAAEDGGARNAVGWPCAAVAVAMFTARFGATDDEDGRDCGATVSNGVALVPRCVECLVCMAKSLPLNNEDPGGADATAELDEDNSAGVVALLAGVTGCATVDTDTGAGVGPISAQAGVMSGSVADRDAVSDGGAAAGVEDDAEGMDIDEADDANGDAKKAHVVPSGELMVARDDDGTAGDDIVDADTAAGVDAVVAAGAAYSEPPGKGAAGGSTTACVCCRDGTCENREPATAAAVAGPEPAGATPEESVADAGAPRLSTPAHDVPDDGCCAGPFGGGSPRHMATESLQVVAPVPG